MFLSSNFVARLVTSWATRNVKQATLCSNDKVVQLDMGLSLRQVTTGKKPQGKNMKQRTNEQ